MTVDRRKFLKEITKIGGAVLAGGAVGYTAFPNREATKPKLPPSTVIIAEGLGQTDEAQIINPDAEITEIFVPKPGFGTIDINVKSYPGNNYYNGSRTQFVSLALHDSVVKGRDVRVIYGHGISGLQDDDTVIEIADKNVPSARPDRIYLRGQGFQFTKFGSSGYNQYGGINIVSLISGTSEHYTPAYVRSETIKQDVLNGDSRSLEHRLGELAEHAQDGRSLTKHEVTLLQSALQKNLKELARAHPQISAALSR